MSTNQIGKPGTSNLPAAPCHDCKDRVIGCHGKCEKYLEFRKKLDIQNEHERYSKRNPREIDNYGLGLFMYRGNR